MSFFRSNDKSKVTDKPKRKKSVIILLLLAVVMLLFLASGFITDWMWFGEVGYTSVFFKGLTTQLIMGVPIFILIFFVTDVYLRRIKQRYFDMVRSDAEPDRAKLSNLTNLIAGGFALLLSWIASTGLWYDWLMFGNATKFGVKKPSTIQ